MSKSEEIARYATEHLDISCVDIARLFGVSKQRVSQILDAKLSKHELAERKHSRPSKARTLLSNSRGRLETMLRAGSNLVSISSELHVNYHIVLLAVRSDDHLRSLHEANSTTESIMLKVSKLWLAQKTLREIIRELGLTIPNVNLAVRISYWRKTHANLFPHRIDNQSHTAEERRKRHAELKALGTLSLEAQAAVMGYKNKASMRSCVRTPKSTN